VIIREANIFIINVTFKNIDASIFDKRQLPNELLIPNAAVG